MTTTIASNVTAYLTEKGQERYRATCPECGRKFAGKFYAREAAKALTKHTGEAHA